MQRYSKDRLANSTFEKINSVFRKGIYLNSSFIFAFWLYDRNACIKWFNSFMVGRILRTTYLRRIRRATGDKLLKEGVEVQVVVIYKDKLESLKNSASVNLSTQKNDTSPNLTDCAIAYLLLANKRFVTACFKKEYFRPDFL